MRKRRVSAVWIGALALGLACWLGRPGMVFSDAPWMGDEAVTDIAVFGWKPDIAVDENGNAQAVWGDCRTGAHCTVYSSYRLAGGAWRPNVRVVDQSVWQSAGPVAIDVDATGTAYAVWVDYRNNPEGWSTAESWEADIYFSFRPLGGTWSPNQRVNDVIRSAGGYNQDKPVAIAVDDAGNAVAVWVDVRNDPDGKCDEVTCGADVFFDHRPAGGAWGTDVRVNDVAGNLGRWGDQVGVALDGAGKAYVVWVEPRAPGALFFSQSLEEGGWAASEPIARTSVFSGQGLGISADDGGDAWVVWPCESYGIGSRVCVSHRPSGGSWEPEVVVSEDHDSCRFFPDIAVDASRNVHAVWGDGRGSPDGCSWLDIYSAYRPAAGEWQPNVRVTDGTDDAPWNWYPSVDVDGSGQVYVVWDQEHEEPAGVYFARRPRGAAISHIEVTQAIQDQTNSVPLIERKPTFVRVYVDCGAGCTSLPNVSGVLRGYGPSGELQGSPLSPVSRFIVASNQPWTDQRGELDKTLNFTLPPEWTTGSVTVTAEVRAPGVYDTLPEEVTFQSARTLRVAYVPIRYDPFPLCVWLGASAPDQDRIASAYWWAQKVYPTARIEYFAWPTMDWGLPLRTALACLGEASVENVKKLNFSLSLQWSLSEGTRPEYVFGWLPDDASVGGTADPTWPDWPGLGLAAHGNDDPTEGPGTFAHEIGHLLGRRHTMIPSLQQRTCENPDWEYIQEHPEAAGYYDWPYPTAKIQQWGLDGSSFGWLVSSSSALKNPDETYDYMSYCGSLAEDTVWTSPATYEHVYSQALQLGVTGLESRLLSSPEANFISSGLVYKDDTAVVDPIWVISSTVTPENPPAGTQYCLEAQDASNIALVSQCFDLTFVNYETGEATDVDGFNLMLPYPSGVARIVLKKETTELAVQPVSPNAPVVTVVSPNGGETWTAGDTYDIIWSATDADGDSLTYSVMYSPDGSDWIAVGGTVTETQVTVNSGELPGSDTASVRVLASDGVNTSEDQSDDLFTVGGKPPWVTILSPEDSISVLPGTPILLQGYAYDLEDGVPEEDALHWSSDRDGSLGAGSQVLVTLSPGQHTITFTAEDSDGNAVTATVDVGGGYETWLAIALKRY